MSRKYQYNNQLKPIDVQTTLNAVAGGKMRREEKKIKKQALHETLGDDVENKGLWHQTKVVTTKKKNSYAYKRRKWDSQSHFDLDESRNKIKELLQEQKIYLENIKKAKTKLKQEEDEALLRKHRKMELKLRLEKRREKQKSYESSMYTNKKYKLKYGERRTYHGNLVAVDANENDGRNDSRRRRQQSLPSLPSPKTCKGRKRIQTFTSSKSSTDLRLSRSQRNVQNTRSSQRSEKKTMRRAKLIKDLEEAQKWNVCSEFGSSASVKIVQNSLNMEEKDVEDSHAGEGKDTLLLTLVMMNIFIAVVSNVYERIENASEETYEKELDAYMFDQIPYGFIDHVKVVEHITYNHDSRSFDDESDNWKSEIDAKIRSNGKELRSTKEDLKKELKDTNEKLEKILRMLSRES
eukprot:g15466.t1